MVDPPLYRRASLLHNMTWLTAGNVLVKPLWFLFITLFCMRVLGVAGYGSFSAALALMTIVASFSDVGTSEYTIREVSREQAVGALFFSNLLLLRFFLAVGSVGGAILLATIAGHNTDDVQLLAFAGLYAVGLRSVEFCRAFYRSAEVLRYESVSLVAEKILVAGVGLIGLWLARSPSGVLGGMAAGMGLALVSNLLWVHHRIARFDYSLVKLRFTRSALIRSLPLGIAAFFALAFMNGGTVLVEAIGGTTMAGTYSAAFRIIEALQFLPAIATAALLPRLSALYSTVDIAPFARLLKKALLLAGGAAALGAVLLAFTAEVVIQWLDPRGEFTQAAPLLRVFAWAFPLMTCNGLLTSALIASDQRRYLAVLLGIITLILLPAQALLIPIYGPFGAAIAFLAGQVAVLFGFYARLSSIVVSPVS